jgi:2-polyprenyl-6-methoxyphenol hydroxylase-like FAD-dependent oxidoreductase
MDKPVILQIVKEGYQPRTERINVGWVKSALAVSLAGYPGYSRGGGPGASGCRGGRMAGESPSAVEVVRVRCCIAGGGPAGMMLGLLLARAGVTVVVLEKHADFLRDFRGDTIHPSTLELMDELGLLEAFLQLPHQEVPELRARVGDTEVPIADFRSLPTRCRFLAFMPQWDFLSFLATHAAHYPTFQLRMQAEVRELLREPARVAGVRAHTPAGRLEVHADLVVGADGRDSVVRAQAGLESRALGAPMDVLWFRLSRRPDDPAQTMGVFQPGRIFVQIDRGAYWQCGYVIPKGAFAGLRAEGLDAFRGAVATAAPFAADRVGELESWEAVRLLTVRVDRLRRWYAPGVLCLGDAAHAMSPIGGVGVNLAIQDAVAAANRLAVPLRKARPARGDLLGVQRRRAWPTAIIQGLQVVIQRRLIAPVLARTAPQRLPLPIRLLARYPRLRRLPARLIGLGIRREHVRSVAARCDA